MDVQSTFLHGTIDEDIYMDLPQGYAVKKGQEHLVCKLRKALYGLKQSPNCWFACIRDYLIEMGFVQNTSDLNVFLLKDQDGFVILALYVDDTILISDSPSGTLIKAKEILSSRFSMTDLGELHSFLGISVKKDRTKHEIKLLQESYVKQVLRKFNMDSSKPCATPASTMSQLLPLPQPITPQDLARMEQIPYRAACGSLQHLQVSTRPDISKSVSYVCQYFQSYGESHWTAVKWSLAILREP